jgi:hypothetical protein
MYRRRHEPVAGFLVHFVFNRIGIHRNFDDDVEFVGHVAPGA